MKIDKARINNILVVSLTNIGDVILTFPVVDILKRDFPDAELSIVIGPKSASFFNGNDCFKKVYIFDKHQSIINMIKWGFSLKKDGFDLVVDLRNTAIGFFLSPKYRTTLHLGNDWKLHMKDKHLNRLKSIYAFEGEAREKFAVSIHEQDKKIVDELIEDKIGLDTKYIVIAPGAADPSKRWSSKQFAQLSDGLIEKYGADIVFVGNAEDGKIVNEICGLMHKNAFNFCGLFSLIQLAALLKKSVLLIGNDSSPMHLASYLDVPVVALFGPTSPKKYGPWSKKCFYIKNNSDCPVCKGQRKNEKHSCMNNIKVNDVIDSIKKLSLFENE